MIRKLEMTVDFVKLQKNKVRVLRALENEVLFKGTDFASKIKQRINSTQNYNKEELFPLKQSTLNIRKMKGITGSKPLIETGKLLKSIKNVRKKNKIGVSMLKYGMHQAKGFTTKNHFAVKKGDKVLGYRYYSSGIRVLPRPFVYPIKGQIKKSQTDNDVFAGLIDVNKDTKKRAVKSMRKYLKGKVVKNF